MKFGLKTSILSSALVALVFLGNTAKATPINGTIDFGGGSIALDTGNLATATKFTSITGVSVTDGNNAYAGTAGDAVNFTAFSFAASGVTPLWTFSAGGVLYSFNATSITIATQNSSFLNLTGSGTAFILGGSGGYSPTAGVWSITDTGGSGLFTFSAFTTVPDEGSTALMIGLGLAAIAVAVAVQRRKLATA